MNIATGFSRDGSNNPQNPAQITSLGNSSASSDLFCFNIAIGENSAITVDRNNGNNAISEAVNIATNGADIDTTVSGNDFGNGVNIRVGTGNLRLFDLPSGQEDNVLTITSTGIVGISSNSSSGISSRRFKRNIESLQGGEHRLLDIIPKAFYFFGEKDDGYKHYGIIAEELRHILPELVRYDDEGQPESIRYVELVPLLLQLLQNQQKTIQTQQEHINKQEEQIALQRYNMAEQQRQIQDIYRRIGCEFRC